MDTNETKHEGLTDKETRDYLAKEQQKVWGAGKSEESLKFLEEDLVKIGRASCRERV